MAEAERFPIRFRTQRGHLTHAGRVIQWNDYALIEAACGGVNPPIAGQERRDNSDATPTCALCAHQIARAALRGEEAS